MYKQTNKISAVDKTTCQCS